jgi:hypothetical protein
MICYNDNQSATKLFQTTYLMKKKEKKAAYELLLKDAFHFTIKLDDIYDHFWPIGTHYFLPTSISRTNLVYQAQHPFKNMLVVGEMVSQFNQGWVEGALQSVDAVLTKSWTTLI